MTMQRVTRRRAFGRWLTRCCAIGFPIYAVTLAVFTHWPNLKLQTGGFTAFDKVAHLGAFAVWSSLLALAGWLAAPGSWAATWRAVGLGLIYGGLDEALQAAPGVNREVSLLDYGANAGGAVLGGFIALIGWRIFVGPKGS